MGPRLSPGKDGRCLRLAWLSSWRRPPCSRSPIMHARSPGSASSARSSLPEPASGAFAVVRRKERGGGGGAGSERQGTIDMTAPDQRPIINIDAASYTDRGNGKQFVVKIARVGAQLGLHGLGCSVHVVPPGKKAFPFHRHHVMD